PPRPQQVRCTVILEVAPQALAELPLPGKSGSAVRAGFQVTRDLAAGNRVQFIVQERREPIPYLPAHHLSRSPSRRHRGRAATACARAPGATSPCQSVPRRLARSPCKTDLPAPAAPSLRGTRPRVGPAPRGPIRPRSCSPSQLRDPSPPAPESEALRRTRPYRLPSGGGASA